MSALSTLATVIPADAGLLELVLPGLALGVSGGLLYAILRFLKFLLIYLGVALPAVWSKDTQRRKDALTTLKELLPLIKSSSRAP
ncbi:hypothetical protein [Streptomyces sp. NBC_00687]|uniref:hypothetical protein n=1 Tax=Streptomyces sp. NBC_00687 TaxID=2975807 RepID=UPI00225039C0|nr:hypothetical protein [Streptomyces sp. NBC_00687]MCX4920301.1 hypothetical protein [Streptomyces sp. NBC_00687]